MQLVLSSSWWFILLCLILGAGYSYLLYKPQFKDFSYKLMAVLRALSVSLLAFFLLGPVLVRMSSETEKPKIIMVLDNSESVLSNNNAPYYKGEFLKSWYSMPTALGEDYDVEFINLGGDIKISDSADFKAKKTNIGAAFDYINNTYAKQNIGAVVLASDGIYNRGTNPSYKTINNHSPVYTLGMGDTALKKDIILKSANTNAIAYLNNSFPVEINLSAYECGGQSTTLTISENGKTLHSQVITIDKKDFFKSVTVNLDATQPGTKHLTAVLSNIKGEHSIINNKKDIFIEIIDGREKILLTYSGPHPDIGAIKEAISVNKNYEVISIQANELNFSDISKYSVAILYQLPSRFYNSANLVKALRSNNIPLWIIAGNQTSIEQLSSISPVAKIDRHQGRFNEAQAFFNTNFNAFTVEDNTRQTINALPPLNVPYGQYTGTDMIEVLAYQKIGSVNTSIPLWGFSNQNNEKTAYLFGEGFWKWRMLDFVENESHFATNELVGKTIQYLTVKEDKRKFRVYPVKNVYEEDEPVRFIAELYNASYELINTNEVKLSLNNEARQVYNYTFSKNDRSYALDLGLLPPGAYQYTAKAEGITETVSGQLIVTALQTELVNTRADFGLLRDISNKHKGEFMPASDIAKLASKIKANTAVTAVTYNEKKPEELISLKWVFFLLLFLISAEWFIRKYEGAY